MRNTQSGLRLRTFGSAHTGDGPEEIAKRLLDKARQALAVARPGGVGSERFEVITDDAVLDGVAGRPVLIDRRR